MTAPLDRARLREAALRYNQQFGPDTVLALLDALDAAERERDEAQKHAAECVLREWAAKAERDALAADARRYRVLCETHPGVLCFMGRDYRDKDELDAAIDEYIALDGAKEPT